MCSKSREIVKTLWNLLHILNLLKEIHNDKHIPRTKKWQNWKKKILDFCHYIFSVFKNSHINDKSQKNRAEAFFFTQKNEFVSVTL